jgi:hypothetical protein
MIGGGGSSSGIGGRGPAGGGWCCNRGLGRRRVLLEGRGVPMRGAGVEIVFSC